MLNERYFEILNFIKKYIATNGYSPTIRDISVGTNIKSVSTLQRYLKGLINNNLIRIDKNKSRAIELLCENEFENNKEAVSIPLKDNPNDQRNEMILIPFFMVEEYKKENLIAYKVNNSIFIIDKSLRILEKLSLFIENNNYNIAINSDGELVGNVVSELKKY